MARGDLLRRHSEYYNTALDCIDEFHTYLESEPKHENPTCTCTCRWGEAWRWFLKQKIDVERKVCRVY